MAPVVWTVSANSYKVPGGVCLLRRGRCSADVPPNGQEGRRDAAQGLGSDGDLLLISA